MEIWKDIEGYDGLYQASNYGNIRSTDTIINCKGANNIDKHLRKGRILKKQINQKGYYYVNLSKNSKVKNVRVHRVIAKTFIPNYNNYLLINHIDGNKLNNCVENLEWCDYSHNLKEAYKNKLKVGTYKGKFGKNHNLSKTVLQYDLDGNFIKEWENAEEIKRKLGYEANNIRCVCRGERKHANNYIWKYKEEKNGI